MANLTAAAMIARAVLASASTMVFLFPRLPQERKKKAREEGQPKCAHARVPPVDVPKKQRKGPAQCALFRVSDTGNVPPPPFFDNIMVHEKDRTGPAGDSKKRVIVFSWGRGGTITSAVIVVRAADAS